MGSQAFRDAIVSLRLGLVSLNLLDLFGHSHAGSVAGTPIFAGYVADRGSVGCNESAWLDRFSALLRQGSSVLDIGCGSGEPVVRYLIEQGFAETAGQVSK